MQAGVCAFAPTYRKGGDPERIRSSGLQIGNLPLYPAELRERAKTIEDLRSPQALGALDTFALAR